MIFKNREEAGEKLAEILLKYKKDDPIILAIPRGGVVIGDQVAIKLEKPLDIVIARKITIPEYPEFGIGALAEGGITLLDEDNIKLLNLTEKEIIESIKREQVEIDRRIKLYRGEKKFSDLNNKVVILVDDGLATGVTARAVIKAIKKYKPKKIIFALPVCASDTADNLSAKVEEIICLFKPLEFAAVGSWYEDFRQISDQEVVELLHQKH